MTARIRLDIAYVGTRYAGWQRQSNAVSIQEIIEKILSGIYDRQIQLAGAGRTDTGVHAAGQVAHFDIDRERPPVSRLRYILNRLLPSDISIQNARPVSRFFHARKSAVERTYLYRIRTNPVPDPFTMPYVWFHPPAAECSVEKMRRAAKTWIGTKDFAAFTIDRKKGQRTKRNMKRITIRKTKDEIRMTFVADAFMYRMIRRMVVYLVDVGMGKKVGGPAYSAPASGLCLMKVVYR